METSTYTYFYEFEGEDIWVKAFDTEELNYWYIKIHEIPSNGGKMTYNAIEAEYVEGKWEMNHYELYDLDCILGHPTWASCTCRDWVHNWQIVLPIEILTTEELTEILHSYPIVDDYEEDDE